MRRFLALFLVSIFSALPLYLARLDVTSAHVPACCRRSGAHKCSMAGSMPPSGAQSVRAKCPFSMPRLPEAALNFASLAIKSQVSSGLLIDWAESLPYTSSGVRSNRERSHQKRGPPFFLI